MAEQQKPQLHCGGKQNIADGVMLVNQLLETVLEDKY
jgi:hypothetical protein